MRSGLSLRAIVHEMQEDAEVRKPQRATERLTKVVWNWRVAEEGDELRDTPVTNGLRLLAEDGQRVRRVAEVSKQGKEELSIPGEESELGL